MKPYRVNLPVEIDGKIYQHGEVVELNDETAKLYRHAIIAVKLVEQENN